MRGAVLSLLAATAACSPSSSPSSDPSEPTIQTDADGPTPIVPEKLPQGARMAESLVGEWRVAGIDGTAVELPHAMTATISANTIRIQSQCVVFERRYRLDGYALLELPEGEPFAVCDRGRFPEEEAAETALANADTAYRLPDGSLVLSGQKSSITLFTQ